MNFREVTFRKSPEILKCIFLFFFSGKKADDFKRLEDLSKHSVVFGNVVSMATNMVFFI